MGLKHTKPINVGKALMRVDFKRLRKQKRELLDVLSNTSDFEAAASFDGLVGFIDAFQDAAAEVLGAKAVFGKDA